jgi:ACS family hexuronate transporter-like MFS transporter
MFPKKAVASVVGFGGFTGTLGVMLITYFGTRLQDYHLALGTIERAYDILFIFCAVAYLVAWGIMKILVPRYKVIKDV